ncbi:hypothetical protein [Sporosarcina sp. NPDC096371]|uniref:hypothetical protein n=1 Tax=Sporosarcina sp. NPDC096371 TaxID=3364530 RepID=UPI0037F806C3
MMKAYTILGDNKDTPALIEHLRGKDNGTITVVDECVKGLFAKGDITYVDPTYVESVKGSGLPVVFYHYIQPVHRRDGRKWRASKSSDGYSSEV